MKIKLQKQEIVSRMASYGRNWLIVSPDGAYDFKWSTTEAHDVPKVEDGHFVAALPPALDTEEMREVSQRIFDAEIADDPEGYGRAIWGFIEHQIKGLDMDMIGYAHVLHPDEWDEYSGRARFELADIWLADLNNLDSPDAPWGYTANGDKTYTPIILPFVLEWV